jgi:methylmalonyl-CoA/ethylmalonyl-CoA epimerase
MIRKIDHIAIAVENLDEALALYESALGLKAACRERIPGFGVETATIPVGDTAIELVEGTSDDSAIRKFVRARGAGIHHIAFAVDDISSSIATLRERGVRLVDAAPRRGKDNSLVAFIHPASTLKILYELVQPARKK